jgi:hypothetical protein
MKKQLILILLLLTSVSYTFADSIPTLDTSTIYNAERIIDKYSGKISESFSEGIKQVAPVAKQSFYMVVKLQIAKGISLFLPLLLAIIFLFLFYKEYKRIETILASGNVPNHMNSHYGVFSDDNCNPLLIIYMAFGIMFLIGSVFTTIDAITYVIAPEWYAIKEIIDLFK